MKRREAPETPMQPVEDPILCRPYEEPHEHWFYHERTGIPRRTPGRRPASYWYKGNKAAGVQRAQLSLFAEEMRDELPLVNCLRDDVRRWRESGYENASSTTKQLLSHWWREDRSRRLFFCQLEAAETVIYLREILATGRKPRWKPTLSLEDYRLLMEGKNPRPGEWRPRVAQHPKLVDIPNELELHPLTRYACKMAMGSGKTVVMAMLVAWAFCNRGVNPGDPRYPRRVLIVCPNLTIRERLDVLRPEQPGNYYERFEQVQAAAPGQERVPPVMILVCDNTSIAHHFHRQISGEEMVEMDEPDDEDEEDRPSKTRAGRKPKKQKQYGTGAVFPECLSNRQSMEVTLRIDSELLAEAENQNPNATRKEAAEELRRIVGTIGKPGEPGEHVRCVISVNMLSEGWDANNVTHILGLRAFGSQLLCEQVVGRGLRRMDYTPDPRTGRFTPEYVDIFGVPFSLIPFKGREPGKGPQPEDRPRNEVMALPECKQHEIRFPVVEGYVAALRKNLIQCDVAATEPTRVDPWSTPTATFIRPQVGYLSGSPSAYGGFGLELVDREAYYSSTHPQTIEFEIAREIVRGLTESAHPGRETLRRQSRRALFPQVLRVVQEYIRTRVENDVHPCEVGLQMYAQRVASLLLDAIQLDETKGETPLLPRLNRYKPIASTASVHFKTVKPVQAAGRSHINYV